MSEDFLADDGRSRAARACERARAAAQPKPQLRDVVARLPPPPPLQLSREGFDLIAEVKLRSPAVGQLRAAASEDVAGARARLCRGGRGRRVGADRADALRRLDATSRAGGARAAPRAACRRCARTSSSIPTRCSRRALPARAACCVILRMLPRAALEALLDAALEQRPVRAARGLRRGGDRRWRASCSRRAAAATTQLLVGVNCRDLVTLQVVPGRLEAAGAAAAARRAARGRERRGDAGGRRADGARPATTSRWSAAR